jgi:hypothetical protein
MSSSNSPSNSSSLVQPIVVAVSGDAHPVDATVPLVTSPLPSSTPTSSNAASVDRSAVNAAATKQLHLKLLDVEAGLENAAIAHGLTTALLKGGFASVLSKVRRDIRNMRESMCDEARQKHGLALPAIKFIDTKNHISLFFSKAVRTVVDPCDEYRKHLELSSGLSTPVIQEKFQLLLVECKRLVKRVAEHNWFQHIKKECQSIIWSLSGLYFRSSTQFILEDQSCSEKTKGVTTPSVIHRINPLYADVSRATPNQKRSISQFFDENPSDRSPSARDVASVHRERNRQSELARTAALLAPSEDDW